MQWLSLQELKPILNSSPSYMSERQYHFKTVVALKWEGTFGNAPFHFIAYQAIFIAGSSICLQNVRNLS